MKTVTDLKRRLRVGTAIVLDRFEDKYGRAHHKWLNITRYIVHVQSNSYCLHMDRNADRKDWSWGDWPKRDEVEFDADGKGFTIRDGHILLHYTILD